MTNYKLIQNREELERFVNFLPDTDEGERYYVTLFARKKYDSTGVIKGDRQQLKRVVAKKEHLISKIEQMESKLGSYLYQGQPVPEESLVLYIGTNKRSMHKAKRMVMAELLKRIDDPNCNPVSESLTAMQKCPVSNSPFYDVDFDLRNVSHRENLIHEVRMRTHDKCEIVVTRGGFHALIKIEDQELRKDWYKRIQEMKGQYPYMIEDVQMNGKDGLTPVPGCTQGGFVPYLWLR